MSSLDKIRAQLQSITPGPWSAEPYLYGSIEDGRIRVTSPSDAGIHNLAEDVLPNDAAFIAAAPSTVARLLGIVERVEALHTFAHKDVEPLAKGYRFSGDHCAYDGEHWPCATIAAITGEGA